MASTPDCYSNSDFREHGLLLACARTSLDATARAQIKTMLAGRIAWDCLVALARAHHIVPLLYRSLSDLSFHEVPESVRASLAVEARATARDNLLLTQELLSILDLFAEARITAVPFKGPLLAHTYYGDLGLRQFADLDICIAKADFPQAKALLRARGYRPQFWHAGRAEAAYLRAHHDYSLVRDDGVIVDLQWGVMQEPFAFALDLSSGLTPVDLAGRKLPTFTSEELLLALCVHGSKHLWERLVWICDIAELIRACPELRWPVVIEHARKLRVERMVRLGLQLTTALRLVTIPPPLAAWAEADAVATRLREQVRSAYLRAPDAPSLVEEDAPLFYLRMHEAWRDRLRLCLRFAPSLLRPRRLWAKYGRPLVRMRSGG